MELLSISQSKDFLLDHVDTLAQCNEEDRARLNKLHELIIIELRLVGKHAEFHPNYEEPPTHEHQQMQMENRLNLQGKGSEYPQHDPICEQKQMQRQDIPPSHGCDHPQHEGSSEKRIV